MKRVFYAIFALASVSLFLNSKQLSLPGSLDYFELEKVRFEQTFNLLADNLTNGDWKSVLSLAMPRFKEKLLNQFGELGPEIDYIEIEKLRGSTFSYNEEDGYFCLVILKARIGSSSASYYGISRWFLYKDKWRFDGLPIPQSGVSDAFQLPMTMKD